MRRLLAILGVGAVGIAGGVSVSAASDTSAVAGTVRVAKGETLTEIATRYHTTVSALAQANDITNPNLVYSGAVLQIPSASSNPPALAQSTTVTLTRGETLAAIASQYHTTVAALVAANHIANPNLVYAGAVVQIPSSGSGSTGNAVPASTIVVEQGDTLTSLATRYHTTAAAIAAANGITNLNLVRIGAHLRLPDQSMALASYTVPVSGGGGLPAQLLAHTDRLALRPDFVQAATSYGVRASLLEALCWWESGWQNSVVSSTGAIGICQIEPSTANFVNTTLNPGRNLNVRSTTGNIAIAAAYLHYLVGRAGGSERLAVAGYYQGLLSVERSGMLASTKTYVTGIFAYAGIFAVN